MALEPISAPALKTRIGLRSQSRGASSRYRRLLILYRAYGFMERIVKQLPELAFMSLA